MFVTSYFLVLIPLNDDSKPLPLQEPEGGWDRTVLQAEVWQCDYSRQVEMDTLMINLLLLLRMAPSEDSFLGIAFQG